MKHLELVFTNTSERLDLLDDSSLQMVYQVMTDISTKGGTFSYDMSLAGSGNNNNIFNGLFDEHFYLPDTGSTIFINKNIPAHIDFDGLPFIYGQFVLTEIDNNNGNITYIGHFTTELRSFGDELGDHKIIGNELDPTNDNALYDIDFSEYNHTFNWNNIDLSNNNTSPTIQWDGTTFPNFYNNSRGVYYGLIDLEGPNSINLTVTDRALVQNFRQCIYGKELWDKIWSRTTYNYESEFINSSYFKSLVIPYTFDNTNIDFSRNVDGTADQEFNVGLKTDFSGYNGVSTHFPNPYNFSGHTLNSFCGDYGASWTWKTIPWSATGGTTPIGIDYFVNDEAVLDFTTCVNGDCTWPNAQTPCCTKPYWQVMTSGNYDVSVDLGYNIYWESLNDQSNTIFDPGQVNQVYVGVRLYVLYNDGQIRLLNETVISENFEGQTNRKSRRMLLDNTHNIIVTIEGEDLWAGNKIFVVAGIWNRLDYTSTWTWNWTWLDVQAGYTFFKNKYNAKPYFYYGQEVEMKRLLPPNYNQIDYIKDIMNYFNLVAQPIQGTKTIKIEPWDVFYDVTGRTDCIEWRGANFDKVDNSQQKTIEAIPDLLYQDFWLNPKQDNNDTNLSNYYKKYNRIFGSVNVHNPYLKTDSKIVTTNLASTMMNKYGTTNWTMAQLWNKDKQPESINIPPEETYEPRLLFRLKLPASSSQPLSKVWGYGNYNNSVAESATSVTIPATTGTTITFAMDVNADGSYPYFPPATWVDGIVVYETDQNILMMGTFNPPSGGNIGFVVKYIQGSGTHGSVSDKWLLRTITDVTFGYGGNYQYQPYVGTLFSPYSAVSQLDINFGLANYYLVSNPSANNVFNIFWKNKVMTYIDPNSKYVTYYVWLNISDIMNLDFRTKILIDNNLYLLNKITWTPNKSAKCELIKLSDYPAGQGASGGQKGINGPYFEGGAGFLLDPATSGNTVADNSGNTISTTTYRDITNVVETYNKQTGIGIYAGYSGFTTGMVDIKNYFPNNSSGVINGQGNRISANSFQLINSNYNDIQHDNITLINTTGFTTTDSGKTYINNIDADTLTTYSYVDIKTGATLTGAYAYTDSKSGQTLIESNNYTDIKTGDTIQYADNTYATKGGTFDNDIKTTQTFKTAGQFVIGDNYNGTGRTITLSSSDRVDGKVFFIHDLKGNANINNIEIFAEMTFPALTTITTANGVKMIYSDGSNWYST